MNLTVHKFIENIIEAVRLENEERKYHGSSEFDAVEFFAVLEQQLGNDKYSEFHKDLQNEYSVYLEENKDGFYNLPKFIIQFIDWQNINYHYEVGLGYGQRSWGYCQCEPTDEGYNPLYGCCGHGCDWEAPVFSVTKMLTVGTSAFNGYESDLWDYIDKYNNVTLEEKKRRDMKIKLDNLLEKRELIEQQIAELNELME